MGTHKIWAQVYLCAAAATFSRCFYDLTDGQLKGILLRRRQEREQEREQQRE